MADISQYLNAILEAVYGEQVRGSIHDAIELINDVGEVVLSTGTAVSSASSSSEGYYTDSLYFNTTTQELWKCIGTDTWQSQGILKGDKGDDGDDGVGITSIEKTGTSGLVDIYTITYTDGNHTTFNVTNGEDGNDGVGITSITKTSTSGLVDTYTILYTDGNSTTFDVTNGTVGNKWYTGTAISGKSSTPTVFSGSGITYAYAGDMYLNTSEGAIYHCDDEGDASTATWVYDFTVAGGGGGAEVLSDLTDVDITSIADDQILRYNSSTSKWENESLSIPNPLTAGTGIDITNDVVSLDAELDDIDDVDITTPADGHVLAFDYSTQKWKNMSLATEGVVRYAGSTTLAALTSGHSSFLTADYEDKFFLVTTGGTLDSTTAAYFVPSFNNGDVIPDDAHIAVINYGTVANPDYRFDDFGGYIDISGKADKTELDGWIVATGTVANKQVSFSGIDDTANRGYEPFALITSASTNKNPRFSISSLSGDQTSNMSVTFTTDADNGTTVKLRVLK